MNNANITTQAEITFWSILIKVFIFIRIGVQHLEQFCSRYSLELKISLLGLFLGLVLGIAISVFRYL